MMWVHNAGQVSLVDNSNCLALTSWVNSSIYFHVLSSASKSSTLNADLEGMEKSQPSLLTLVWKIIPFH